MRSEWLKYWIYIWCRIRTILPFPRRTVDLTGHIVGMSDKCSCFCLPRHHIPTSFRTTPFVFAARLAVVLPPKRPELRSNGTGTRTLLVPRLFTAPSIATAAAVRVGSLSNPSEFGADLFEIGLPWRLHHVVGI